MRVLLFTGKGGVGTTTVAAATAVRASRRGVKTLVLSVDPAPTLAGVLRPDWRSGSQAGDAGPAQGLRHGPVEIEPGLFAQHLDAGVRAECSWDCVQKYWLTLLDTIGLDPLMADELTDVPGVRDVLMLFELRDQIRAGRWDLVVVDTGPTDRALRLLALPESLSNRLRRLLPAERRIDRALSPVLRSGRNPGAGAPLPTDAVVEAISRLQAELAGVQEVLAAACTSARLVTSPASAAVAESGRALTSLALFGYVTDKVVVNRVFPDGGNDPWRVGWAATQRRVLAQIEESLRPVSVSVRPVLPVLAVPYLGHEPVGVDALAELADELDAGADLGVDVDVGPIAPATLSAPVQVERCADGFVLVLHLPGADRRDVDLGRCGDELVVGVHGLRRALALPSALRRCRVVGATLRDGWLRVSFEPDPALWRPL